MLVEKSKKLPMVLYSSYRATCDFGGEKKILLSDVFLTYSKIKQYFSIKYKWGYKLSVFCIITHFNGHIIVLY